MKHETRNHSGVSEKTHWATVNPCCACAPLGASLVFKGICGGMSVLHGSQGCATYIRRFLISHFREPIDIASSSFTEETVVFGGEANLLAAVKAVYTTYSPSIIGIATTCLAETMGEDMDLLVAKIKKEFEHENVDIIAVHSPSYKDSHVGGFNSAVKAVLNRIPQKSGSQKYCTLIPCMLSSRDLRSVKELAALYAVPLILFPDYSETMDGGLWDSYTAIPTGGTKREELESIGSSRLMIDWTGALNGAGSDFSKANNVSFIHALPPIGIKATDSFCDALSSVSGVARPLALQNERSRLLDSYVDGHKYVSGKSVAVCCDEPLVRALTLFCLEIGLVPKLVATARGEKDFTEFIKGQCENVSDLTVISDADFDTIDEILENSAIDICIGTSKLQRFAEKKNIPLVRVGFPIHDRFGASRIAHIGYLGAQQLFDRIVNELIATKQSSAHEQWSYV